ncbi:MAG: hypothetical protein SPI01_01655, partial [Succiniclasticum sp.]|nr:hypothetical protein [Succiniclasticum sp.]
MSGLLLLEASTPGTLTVCRKHAIINYNIMVMDCCLPELLLSGSKTMLLQLIFNLILLSTVIKYFKKTGDFYGNVQVFYPYQSNFRQSCGNAGG